MRDLDPPPTRVCRAPQAEFDACSFASDCTDCGLRSSWSVAPPPSPPSPLSACELIGQSLQAAVHSLVPNATIAYHAIPSFGCGNRFTKTERLAEVFRRRNGGLASATSQGCDFGGS